ncbi:unnamed protein product [Rotaria sordida]|uniref:Uncharacterized protein n=1 Tax=Rotaria sordida TaxID=392033 RepID=A0A814TFG7_9BILA|nr:unnamed protein product [Rotaria sordida]CAF1406443.1 unnamed protein product [Rotaria sordida]
MDDWRIQQQRINMNGIGPIHSYHSLHSRPSPYPINEIKQTYPYQQSSTISVKTDSNSDVYTPLSYTPTHMEHIHHPQQQQQQQQRIITTSKSIPGPISTYHPGHQQIISARARSMPYPSPSMYNHSSTSVCQCNSHIHYPSHNQMFYQNCYQSQPISYQQNSNIMKHKIKSKTDELSTSYYSSNCSNSYIPAQQLQSQSSSISPEYQLYSNQSQIFPSPPSNPSTPYQGEFNGNTDFGVPHHQSQPSSVNSLTDALCPNGDTIDRQMTPGPPSVGTPRVAQHQYSFPQTPLTPTTSRLTNEQNNFDELTAFLQDPINTYLTEDLTSSLFDDIEALADTYLGGRGNVQQSNIDTNLDYDIILNYLCSDDLISTMYKT